MDQRQIPEFGAFRCHRAVRAIALLCPQLPRVQSPEEISLGVVMGSAGVALLVTGLLTLSTCHPAAWAGARVVIHQLADLPMAELRRSAGRSLLSELPGMPVAVAAPVIAFLRSRPPQWLQSYAMPQQSLRAWAALVGVPSSTLHDAIRAKGAVGGAYA